MLITAHLRPVQELEIRALEGIADFQKAEQVQVETWGFRERDIVPAAIFSVARNFGGQAIGALDGERMVGFALSFGALEDGHGHFHSHMVAVVPEYQNRGLGMLIKLAQRADALRRGIDQIMWTFDPLQIRNAYFNTVKLGGIGVRYIPNLYGRTSSPLHGGMPTDRLLIEWNLSSPRVIRALDENVVEVHSGAEFVRIPSASPELPIAERLSGQTTLREQLSTLLNEQYVITGLVRSGDDASYILEKR